MQWASSTASSLMPTARTASQKTPAAESLGHDVHQAELAGRNAIEPGVLLRHRQRAVDETDRQTKRLQLIDLVLHQGDQRRDDQRQAVQSHGRQLVAKALSAAGRHDAQAILPGQNRGNDLLLSVAERGQAEARTGGIRALELRNRASLCQAETSVVNR